MYLDRCSVRAGRAGSPATSTSFMDWPPVETEWSQPSHRFARGPPPERLTQPTRSRDGSHSGAKPHGSRSVSLGLRAAPKPAPAGPRIRPPARSSVLDLTASSRPGARRWSSTPSAGSSRPSPPLLGRLLTGEILGMLERLEWAKGSTPSAPSRTSSPRAFRRAYAVARPRRRRRRRSSPRPVWLEQRTAASAVHPRPRSTPASRSQPRPPISPTLEPNRNSRGPDHEQASAVGRQVLPKSKSGRLRRPRQAPPQTSSVSVQGEGHGCSSSMTPTNGGGGARRARRARAPPWRLNLMSLPNRPETARGSTTSGSDAQRLTPEDLPPAAGAQVYLSES